MAGKREAKHGRGLKEKRVLLSVAQELALEKLVSQMAERLGTRVKASHLIRACLLLLREARREIVAQCGEVQGLNRPSNVEAPRVEEFERAIASVILAALRRIAAEGDP